MKIHRLFAIIPGIIIITLIVLNIVFAAQTPVKNHSYTLESGSSSNKLVYVTDNGEAEERPFDKIVFNNDGTVTGTTSDNRTYKGTYTAENGVVNSFGIEMTKSGYSLEMQAENGTILYSCTDARLIQTLFIVGYIVCAVIAGGYLCYLLIKRYNASIDAKKTD